jgi:hypothetical protein
MKRRRYMMTALGHSNPPPELTPVTVAYIDFTQESGAVSGGDIINGGLYRIEMQQDSLWLKVPDISGGPPCLLRLLSRIRCENEGIYIPTPNAGPYQATLTRIGNPANARLQQEVTATLYNPEGEAFATATAYDTRLDTDGEYTLAIPGLEVQYPEVTLEIYMHLVEGASSNTTKIRTCTLDYLT